MQHNSDIKTAGLVFLCERDLDIVSLSNRAGQVMEMLKRKVLSTRMLSDDTAQVICVGFVAKLHVRRDIRIPELATTNNGSDAMMLDISVSPNAQEDHPDATPQGPGQDTLLAHLLKSMQHHLAADYIQWSDRNLLLSSADFARAAFRDENPTQRAISRSALAPQSKDIFANAIRPARVTCKKSAAKLPGIEETNELLQERMSQKQILTEAPDVSTDLREIFRQNSGPPEVSLGDLDADIEQEAPLRLSAWAIAFTVSLIALPIGAVLLVLNLVKGENLRLASQTAALTGTFIALNSYGATAETLSTLSAFVN